MKAKLINGEITIVYNAVEADSILSERQLILTRQQAARVVEQLDDAIFMWRMEHKK